MAEDKLKNLKAGDSILLNGVIFTARDAAHKKLVEMEEKGEELPFDLQGNVIYYVGPAPKKPGEIIGSCGPTTSGRMDTYTPQLLEKGVKILIGKGQRNQAVKEALKKHEAIYCAATGGVGALLAEKVISAEIIAFHELGAEAIYKLEVKDFPVTVINDCAGGDLYEEAQKQFKV